MVSAAHQERQRGRILSSAIEVFAERGYGLTTVDEICRRAGVSKGAIYTYFPSKEELFLASSREVFERRYASLAAEVEAGTPAASRVRILVDRLGAYVRSEDRAFMRLWVEGYLQSARLPALAEMKTAYQRRFGELLERVIRGEQEAGRLDARLDPRLAADTVLATADGLLLHSLVPGWQADAERILTGLRDFLAPGAGRGR